MKKHVIRLVVVGCILFMTLGSELLAGELSLTLSRVTTIPLLTNFGSGTYKANSTVAAGDVLYEGTKIGDFTELSNSTTYTSQEAVEYSIMLLPSTPQTLSDFISIRMNRSTETQPTGTQSQGVIFATSPALKSLIGLSVIRPGNVSVFKIILP